MRQILYYPRILIPNDWIKKTILYSDKVSSIFPYDIGVIEGQEENLALANMKYLESLGMYEYTRPEQLDFHIHRKLHQAFLDSLDDITLSEVREKYEKSRTSYAIYRSKLNAGTIRFLFDNHIAKLDKDNPECILVEQNVGLLYMSLLAYFSTINREESDYTTSTDELSHRNILFDSNSNQTDDYYLNLILRDIPAPSPMSSIEDIISFKEKRRDELIAFRRYLNDWIERIQNGTSKMNSFRDDFEYHSNLIRRLMSDSKLSIIGNTLEVVIPPLTGLAAQSIFGSLDDSSVIDVASTSVSTLAINRIKSRFIKKEKITNNPLSYLYYVNNNI